MSHAIASDREGRSWAVISAGATLKGHLVSGTATPAVMDLAELIDAHGPLIMTSARPAVTGGFAAIADTVGLVASDPETASIDQIKQVAAFAMSIVRPQGRQGISNPAPPHLCMRASAIEGPAHGEMWGAEVGQKDRRCIDD